MHSKKASEIARALCQQQEATRVCAAGGPCTFASGPRGMLDTTQPCSAQRPCAPAAEHSAAGLPAAAQLAAGLPAGLPAAPSPHSSPPACNNPQQHAPVSSGGTAGGGARWNTAACSCPMRRKATVSSRTLNRPSCCRISSTTAEQVWVWCIRTGTSGSGGLPLHARFGLGCRWRAASVRWPASEASAGRCSPASPRGCHRRRCGHRRCCQRCCCAPASPPCCCCCCSRCHCCCCCCCWDGASGCCCCCCRCTSGCPAAALSSAPCAWLAAAALFASSLPLAPSFPIAPACAAAPACCAEWSCS